jgi:SpoVK/Ycf46/Vps4 family AAA+-type ATPase
MDGIKPTSHVVVIGATNRPNIIDVSNAATDTESGSAVALLSAA